MQKLILSVFISMLATGSYAQNQVGFGPDLGVGMNRSPVQAIPQQVAPPQNYPTNYLTPQLNNTNRMPVRTPMPTNGYNGSNSGFDHSNVEDYAQPDMNYKPIYKNDTAIMAAPVSKPTITPAKTQGSLFEECMIRSSKMLDVLDVLKKIPEKDRISTLYNSGYWNELTDSEKDQTLQTIANMSGVDDPTYLVIKGKMAGSFEKECVDLAKNN